MIEITRLLLENYIGILTATGLSKIEIDRSNSKNVLVLIMGANGSGKTTIMNELTPLPIERVSNRYNSRIIPGKIGRKEIDFLVDKKYLYKCVIIFDKKTTCNISKKNIITNEDYGELNPNGNVNSYIEVIEKELEWTKYYINIGYLSSKVNNIVSMKPQERNDYISMWVSNVDEYINAYQSAQKKYNSINKQIKMLNSDIGKLSEVDYKLAINNYLNNAKELEFKLNDLNEIITTCNTYLNSLPEVDKYVLNKLKNELVDDINKHNNIALKLLEDGKKYKQYTGTDGQIRLRNDLMNSSKLQVQLEEQFKTIDNNIENTKNSIEEYRNDFNDNDKQQIIDIELVLDTLNRDYNNYSSILLEKVKENPNLIEYDSINENDINRLVDLVKTINEISTNINIKSNNDIDNLLNNLEEKYNNLSKELEIISNDLEKQINQKYFLENINFDESILDLKPISCNMKCGIVDMLKTYISPKNEINKLQSTIEKLITDKTNILDELEHIKNQQIEINRTVLTSKNITDMLYTNTKLISIMPKEITDILCEEDIYIIISNMNRLITIVSNAQEYISCKTKIDTINTKKESIKATYKLLENKMKSHDKYNEYMNKFNEYITKRDELINKININKTELQMFEKMNELIKENNSLITSNIENGYLIEERKKDLLILNKQNYIRNHLIDIISIKIKERVSVRTELDNSRRELDVLKAKVASKQTLIDTRDKLEIELHRLDILTKIWSPKVGYPAWVMEDFIDQLTIQTNKDLTNMWDSNLLIEQFKIDTNEIVINRSGTIIEDASECSDGEISTLSLAISFAIIEINLRKYSYNIIRMDEVDGVLDTKRRKSFLETILNRINQLECINTWIITHNNEFDTAEADVILLQGAKLDDVNLYNKNIIFDINSEINNNINI